MSQFGFFNRMTNLWSVDEGEVVQCATAATPVFNLQPTVFECTRDVIGNVQSHAARSVATISQTQGNGKA